MQIIISFICAGSEGECDCTYECKWGHGGAWGCNGGCKMVLSLCISGCVDVLWKSKEVLRNGSTLHRKFWLQRNKMLQGWLWRLLESEYTNYLKIGRTIIVNHLLFNNMNYSRLLKRWPFNRYFHYLIFVLLSLCFQRDVTNKYLKATYNMSKTNCWNDNAILSFFMTHLWYFYHNVINVLSIDN